MQFSTRLVAAMKERNITQRQLAEMIGINETALSRYVNGNRTPRMDILVNMARALNVSVEYLSGRDETETGFQEVKNLVARNLGNMSPEQRLELMAILAGGK